VEKLLSFAASPVTDSLRETALLEHFQEARRAWPGIDVAFELFAERAVPAGKHPPADDAVGANAIDVYLACACSEGDPAALIELEKRYLPGARRVVARIDRSDDFAAEVLQVLRERLLVGPNAKLREYRGTGPLAGWLRTAAVRTALNLRRSDKAHHEDSQVLDHQQEPRPAPDTVLLKERYRADMNGALQRALAQLGSDDRRLLRLHFAEKLTLAIIAAREQVSISTVFRRLTKTTRAVLAAVKRDLGERLQLSPQSLDSLIRDAHEEIDLSLSQLLGEA
jgi:RNA polymerase sigma-70 factor, ECF subfamily